MLLIELEPIFTAPDLFDKCNWYARNAMQYKHSSLMNGYRANYYRLQNIVYLDRTITTNRSISSEQIVQMFLDHNT